VVLSVDLWVLSGRDVSKTFTTEDTGVHRGTPQRWVDTMVVIQSLRLRLSQFQMTDAREVFGCITPGITKFMPWEPPSLSEYLMRCEERVRTPEPKEFSFVIRRIDNGECLGMASLEDADSASPELGLWLKESVHGQGYGGEVVAALVEWGHATLGKGSFIYPVAVQNTASRRIAENLHGEIIGNLKKPKYDCVLYRIPFCESPFSP
jgi:RimJ/RimL family protein N-acetyltransferase